MKTFLAVIVCLTVLSPSLAWAQSSAQVVAKISGAHRFDTNPIQAKLGQDVELSVRLQNARGKLRPLPAGTKVSWLHVMPRPGHKLPQKRNNGLRIYANSLMFGPNHGRWLGYTTLEYDSVEIQPRKGFQIKGNTLTINKAHPTRAKGLGTIWIAAQLTLPNGKTIRTADETSVEPVGLSRKVIRVSFREDDTFVGWLGTYFHVPYVFGSTGIQTSRYTGTDCADVMVGALHASGRKRFKFTSVVGLAKLARPITGDLFLTEQGKINTEKGKAASLRWGRDFRSGDLVAMDFLDDPDNELPRPLDHAAALVQDGSEKQPANGILDGSDILRHMSIRGLVDERLKRMGHIRFRILRWRR